LATASVVVPKKSDAARTTSFWENRSTAVSCAVVGSVWSKVSAKTASAAETVRGRCILWFS
jgi:hypothetical protein